MQNYLAARQNMFSNGAILPHLIDQRFDAFKFRFAANEAIKSDFNFLAVKIAGEIKNIYFEQRRAIVEGGTTAETGDSVINDAINCKPDGINPIGQTVRSIERQIGGRKSQQTAALVAMPHNRAHKIGMTQQIARQRHIARFQRRARRSGGHRFETAILILNDTFDNLDGETKTRAFGA